MMMKSGLSRKSLENDFPDSFFYTYNAQLHFREKLRWHYGMCEINVEKSRKTYLIECNILHFS